MQSGNIIDTVGIDVNKLDVFDVKNLEVNITNGLLATTTTPGTDLSEYYNKMSAMFPGQVYTDVEATLLNGTSWYYDLQAKFELVDNIEDNELFLVSYNEKNITNNVNYFDFISGDFFRIYRDTSNYIVNVYFKVINKETGQIVCIRKITLTGTDESTNITGSIVYDNEDDVSGGSGKVDYSGINDNTSSNFGELYDSKYFEDMVSSDNFIWQFFKTILFGLPSWITIPLNLLLSGVVVITIYRMFRGA